MVKVVIRHASNRLSHSRYGMVRKVETVVRFVDKDALDSLIEDFWARGEVIEVTVSRV